MLDNLYKDIGIKIKVWAQVIFIVGAIGAVITGIVLLADEFILAGLLTLFCGPIVALISTWLLYAFGQLVDDTHVARDQNANIDKNLQMLAKPMIDEAEAKAKREAEEKAKRIAEAKAEREAKAKTKQSENAATFVLHKNNDAPYWCGKCGCDGPYDGNCPECGSSMKFYNTRG